MEYIIEVKGQNSKLRSSLRGFFIPFHDGIVFTFHVKFYGGSRSQGNLIFSGIDDLVDYLKEDCGFESLSFKKL